MGMVKEKLRLDFDVCAGTNRGTAGVLVRAARGASHSTVPAAGRGLCSRAGCAPQVPAAHLSRLSWECVPRLPGAQGKQGGRAGH